MSVDLLDALQLVGFLLVGVIILIALVAVRHRYQWLLAEGGDTMKPLIIVALGVLLLAGVVISPTQADLTTANRATAKMFNGTIDGIDPVQRLVTIQSEEKDMWVFIAVADGEVLKGLNKGDRVVVELDEHGMAKTIVKTATDLKSTRDPER